MEYNLRDDAIRLVIRYLNFDDLKNVCLTCRFWMKIVYEETQKKGPKLVTQEIIINRYNRAVAKNEHVFVSTDMRPCLLLCFTNKDCNSDIAKRHVSKLFPMHCILAELKRDLFEDVNTVWSILIPHSCNLKIETLNFVTRSKMPIRVYRWAKFMGSGKLFYFPEYCLNIIDMFSWYEILLVGTLFRRVFLLLFLTYTEIPKLKEIIEHVSSWHPLAGPIWGGTINSARVCHITSRKRPESIQAECIQIYMTGEDVLTKLLILNEHCDTKEKIQQKFQDLKNEINLKECSIAFMCTSVTRFNDFYEIESAAFKEIFPQVTLAHIFSRRPFGARNFYEFNMYLENIKPHVGNNVTTFLLITYN